MDTWTNNSGGNGEWTNQPGGQSEWANSPGGSGKWSPQYRGITWEEATMTWDDLGILTWNDLAP